MVLTLHSQQLHQQVAVVVVLDQQVQTLMEPLEDQVVEQFHTILVPLALEILLQQFHRKEIVVELEMEIMVVVVADLAQTEKLELLGLEVAMVEQAQLLQ
jgi:hypothetical protein